MEDQKYCLIALFTIIFRQFNLEEPFPGMDQIEDHAKKQFAQNYMNTLEGDQITLDGAKREVIKFLRAVQTTRDFIKLDGLVYLRKMLIQPDELTISTDFPDPRLANYALDVMEQMDPMSFKRCYEKIRDSHLVRSLNFVALFPQKYARSQVIQSRSHKLLKRWAKGLEEAKKHYDSYGDNDNLDEDEADDGGDVLHGRMDRAINL